LVSKLQMVSRQSKPKAAPLDLSEVVEQVVFKGDERPAVRDDAPAEFGERDAPRLAVEQGHAQLLLHCQDRFGQRRLRDLEGDGRAPEAAGFGEDHDLAELAGVHRYPNGYGNGAIW
jgi:hypothetical protein